MTLVSSGILHLTGSSGAPTRSIQYECERVYDGISLTEAQSIASSEVGSLPIDMTDFYELSWSDVIVDFSDSVTWYTNEDDDKDGRQVTVITGWQLGDELSLDIDVDFTIESGSVYCAIYERWYDPAPMEEWNLIDSYTTTTSDSYTITNVDYGFPTWIRVEINGSGVGDVVVTLTGGSFTAGAGTVTAQGSTTWYVGVY